MSTLKNFFRRNRKANQTLDKIKMRSHLNADALFARIREDLQKVPDHRAANASIPLDDALMSGFAMFSLKGPSLLSFDARRLEQPESLHGVYGVLSQQSPFLLMLVSIPCFLSKFWKS